MSPRVGVDELVTGAEIGRRLGISRQRVQQLRVGAPGFPDPLGRVGVSIVYRWRDVEAWAKKHRPAR